MIVFPDMGKPLLSFKTALNECPLSLKIVLFVFKFTFSFVDVESIVIILLGPLKLL